MNKVMEQYIPKSALIAEIEKLKDEALEYEDKSRWFLIAALKKRIESLDVKEVDLEKEYKVFVEEDPVYNKLVNSIVGKAIAKHFFELGLKAQKA